MPISSSMIFGFGSRSNNRENSVERINGKLHMTHEKDLVNMNNAAAIKQQQQQQDLALKVMMNRSNDKKDSHLGNSVSSSIVAECETMDQILSLFNRKPYTLINFFNDEEDYKRKTSASADASHHGRQFNKEILLLQNALAETCDVCSINRKAHEDLARLWNVPKESCLYMLLFSKNNFESSSPILRLPLEKSHFFSSSVNHYNTEIDAGSIVDLDAPYACYSHEFVKVVMELYQFCSIAGSHH